MADDNRIEIVASLNYEVSEASIIGDLKKIQNAFNDAGGLKIGCTINADSLKAIQSQLGKLSQGVTFNVGNTNLEGLNNSIRQTTDTVNGTNQKVQQLLNSLADLDAKYSNPLKAVIDTEGFVKAEETMRKLKAQLSDLGEVSVQGFYGDINGVNKLEKMVATVKSAYGELRTLTFELGDNDFFRFVSGKFDNDGIRKQTEEITKFVDQYTSKLNSLKAKVGENFVPNISATIGEDINKTIVTFDSFEKKLAELKSGKGSIEELRAEFVALDGTVSNLGSLLRGGDSSLNQFTNATIKARNFANDLKALEVEFENLSAVTQNDKLFSSLAEAEQKLVALQNIQKNEGYTENWIRQYQELSVAIKQATEDVKLAKKLEQQDASSATKKQANALREVASAYKEINQYTRTLYSTSATDVEKGLAGAHRGDQYALIEQIKQRLESEGLLDDVLKQEIQNYETIAKEIELIAKSRRDATQAHREEVEAEKAEKQNLQDVNRLISDNIKSLEKFNNSTVAKNNTSNPTVVSQTGLNADLINQLRGLQESLANDKSPENIARITARMNELGSSLRDAKFNSEALDQSLRDESSAAKLESDIRNLTNRVETFANTNKRATESLKLMRSGVTFADEWKRITEQLKSGNLDDNAIRRLSNDLRNFQAEARNANLTTSRFFTDMGNQLKMLVTRWLSLYAVIGRVTSALNDLKEVDKILTEIAKSSDVTRESLEKLGNAAFETANQYGRAAADYLYGVQEFSRAGFRGDQLTGLTEVSLLAQSAGDIETDLANSYVIATNAAYGYKGSVEELTEVLDRQNYVTNNYALNMTDLANATKIAASQAAQSGVEIDEMTAALATMISSTQQGGEIASRALRGILMNIQQVKGEVGDGEEDITTESLSKYEKAAANLGVALKEVRDGVVVLRDPMQVLNDLAVAFNKESDDSIKKAELINAVGGKYRGNQLAALLSNWDTYKDILNTFNSEQAVGSAFRETQKDVESWSGQLNILKNNWDEFINAVINSNTAINTLKGFSGVLNGLVAVSDKLGGLGTVATLISGVAGAKGSGILSAVQQYSRISKSIAGVTTEDVAMLRQYNALIGQGVSVSQASAQALNGASESARRLATNANGAAVSEELLNRAQNKLTVGARAGAVATKALGVALNVAFNMAVVVIISAIVKGLDELIVTQKEATQLAEEQRQNALDAMSAYESESTALNDVVSQYTKAISSTSDLSSQKEQLLNLQNQLPDSYKEEADGIDLVNGKISDNIALLNELERKKADQYVRDNRGAYETAVQELDVGYTYVGRDLPKKFRDQLQDLAAQNNIEGYNSITGQFKGTAQERLELYKQLRDMYAETDEHNSKWLTMLDEQIQKTQKLVDESQSVVDEYEKARKIASLTAQEYNLINQATLAYREYQTSLNSENEDSAKNALSALYSVRDIVYSMSDSSSALRTQFDELWNTFTIGAKESVTSIEEVRADFAELSGEAFDNELKNIESISNAIDSMLNDETLSHEDAWKLLNLDTEGVLSDIQLINGQYKLSTDQLVALMEQQINKQKESIETTKAAAQAEYDLLQAQLRRLKVNSPSDVAAYKLEVERITDEMRDMQDVISGSDLLLQEVNGILGKTYSITGSIATGLSNAVKQFEAEVEAIDNAIDSLNDRKEVLQDEKSILQDQLDALNEQKKTIEDTLATYDRVGEAVDELVKAQVDGIQAQIDALEEERKSIEDYYEEQLDALKEQNEERDDAIEKEEALANLANAQNQKKRVYSSDRGWDYEASKADILKAQNELAKIANNEQIKMLENERDAKLAGYDDRKKEYEAQIKEYEDYASKYTSISNDIKIAENELLAAQILGSDWREKIEQKDEGLLTNYRAQYTSFNEQLNNLTNNEIATLQASIDAKDEEIKKIDDEIAAYNKYKKSVEKSLNDAKTALENYKNSMNDAKAEIINALDGVERETQDKNSKIISHNEAMAKSAEDAKDRMNHAYWEIGNSARELANTLQEHLLHGDIDLAQYVRMMHLDGYADGGVNTSTGIAMLHGTKQKGEVIFNASDSKKLYDMIHGTPNLLADVAKQANKIAGFSPVNNNNSTNSVSVSIGQIVANNPQEFTRGLDVELDKYFRRKLTESYVQ